METGRWDAIGESVWRLDRLVRKTHGVFVAHVKRSDSPNQGQIMLSFLSPISGNHFILSTSSSLHLGFNPPIETAESIEDDDVVIICCSGKPS